MSGNHPSELNPRQRMINMMYLVLTALLALNVSKEVLQSFFDVNKGIERTTTNFNLKNGETYAAFDNAVENNPKKYQKVKEKAYSIKQIADEIVVSIQEMKYDLVLKADKKVYLGPESGFKDKDGDLIKEKAITVPWKNLSAEQQLMNIGDLNAKDDRHSSGDLFWSNKKQENRATALKEKMLKYRDFLISLSEGNENLKASINKVFQLEGNLGKKKNQSWEEYNFYDMPAVGALTLLSKMQADIRNVEADVINYLKRDIEGKLLKFGGAEGIQIPKTNFVLRGDSFRAKIFITAKTPGQDPDIYVGEVDSLGGGKYEMKGVEGVDYETVKVINGKGMFAKRTRTEGNKKWGGLIKMKTETGTKFYPFSGEYLVSSKMVVAAPTNMNVLYKGIKNPISVSVAGYSPSQISISCSNGTIATINKKAGKYEVTPEKLIQENSPIINLFVTVDGKRKSMGSVDFKVKKVPPPEIMCAKKFGGLITKGDLSSATGLFCIMKDFPFDRNALSYQVISYDVSAYNKGVKRNIPTVKSNKFNKKVRDAIKGTPPGGDITFTNIKVKLRGVKNAQTRKKGSLTFTIK